MVEHTTANELTLGDAGFETGDWKLIDSDTLLGSNKQSTSSTSFELAGNRNNNRAIFDLDKHPYSTYGLSAVGRMRCDTANETFTIELDEGNAITNDGEPQISITGSSADDVGSAVAQLTVSSGIQKVIFKFKVTDAGATGTFHTGKAALWGKL